VSIPTLAGVESRLVDTGRIKIHMLENGPAEGRPVLFIQGNVSSATFFESTMLFLPDGYRGIAPDLRGYGETEALPIDATQGIGDMAEDLRALVETLNNVRHKFYFKPPFVPARKEALFC
jgi:pimeloyl-ACP methyl ester carboxylesterase